MSNAIQIYLTEQAAPAGQRSSSVVYAAENGFNIPVSDASSPAALNQKNTLRNIQRAGRKIDQFGIQAVEFSGSNWSSEAQWAFAIGYADPKLDNKIQFAGEKAAELAALYESYSWVRHLINLPPSELYPEALAERVAEKITRVAPKAVTTRLVVGPELLEEKRMGIHTVGRASQYPPVLFELDYNPTGKKDAPISYALVGKGITFDTGGYSIKPSEGMLTMKCDMGGAATLSGALLQAIKQGLNKRVVLILCCAENMIDGAAYKNGDVITYKNGTTVEVVNTDAEGRLVLADGLLRAAELGAERTIDAATLTGAAQVAVGKEYHALFSVDESLAETALKVAAQEQENLWRLPLAPWHQDMCPSSFADTANSRPQKGGGTGGASNAAGFLLRFAPNKGEGWLHFDLAAAYHSQANALFGVGATATGVRTLASLMLESPVLGESA